MSSCRIDGRVTDGNRYAIMRSSLGDRIKCCTSSVCLSVSLSVPYASDFHEIGPRKAVETSDSVETI